MSNVLPTINVCYPRSGHRFLRNILKDYFKEDLKFRANYWSTQRSTGSYIQEANYIKDHDLQLRNNKIGIPIQENSRYLVQYRHPLGSLMSYFEFTVKRGTTKDDPESWDRFIEFNINYWKRFIDKWCLSVPDYAAPHMHRVAYEDLYANTSSVAAGVVKFLTDDRVPIDQDALKRSVMRFQSGFARYVEDQKKGGPIVTEVRDIRKFKYFDESLVEVEKQLASDFLTPLGIVPLLSLPST